MQVKGKSRSLDINYLFADSFFNLEKLCQWSPFEIRFDLSLILENEGFDLEFKDFFNVSSVVVFNQDFCQCLLIQLGQKDSNFFDARKFFDGIEEILELSFDQVT